MSNTTKVKSTGLYVGGSKILNVNQMNNAAKTLNLSTKMLGGLVLNSPQKIVAGKDIGYRPENLSVSVIGGQKKMGGAIWLADGNRILDDGDPQEIQMLGEIKASGARAELGTNARNPFASAAPSITAPTYGYMSSPITYAYSGLGYGDIMRELDRAVYHRKLGRRENRWLKRRKRTSRKKRRRTRKKSRSKRRSKRRS